MRQSLRFGKARKLSGIPQSCLSGFFQLAGFRGKLTQRVRTAAPDKGRVPSRSKETKP
jgi:hypothetical protein